MTFEKKTTWLNHKTNYHLSKNIPSPKFEFKGLNSILFPLKSSENQSNAGTRICFNIRNMINPFQLMQS